MLLCILQFQVPLQQLASSIISTMLSCSTTTTTLRPHRAQLSTRDGGIPHVAARSTRSPIRRGTCLTSATAAKDAVQQQQQQQEQHPRIIISSSSSSNVVNISKRHLMAFGCACCLSLQTQQQLPAAADSGHYSYEGELEGPPRWPGICSSGTQQSPIDLGLQQAQCGARTSPEFRYGPSANATVTNTGHTLQVNLQPGSSSISWAGQQLELLQFHFHTPSEHTVEGAASAMEAHLVHRNTATGAFTVLAVLLEAPPASQEVKQQQQVQPRPNPCLAAGLASVPSLAGTSAPCSSQVNPADLLPPAGPGREQYVAYRGSLTTPPCSEGVDWLVWTQPVGVPQQQVDAFRALARMNARPVQPLNDRGVAANCLTVV